MAIVARGLAPLLQVFDMPTAIGFDRDRLSFEVVETSGRGDDSDWVLLRLGTAELMLDTACEADSRPPAPDPARIAAHRDTAIFFGCPDVDAAHEHLRARGVDVAPPAITG